MKLNVLKIKIDNINFFENNKFELDFTNQIQVTNYDNDHSYYHLDSSIYLAKYISYVGVNASGKTTITELLSEIFNFYFYKKQFNKEVFDKFFMEDPMLITFIYEYNKIVYKIVTSLNANKTTKYGFIEESEYFYYIDEEVIYNKKLTKNTSKKDLFIDKFNEIYRRSILDETSLMFLRKNISMIGILKHDIKQVVVTDTNNKNVYDSFQPKKEISVNIIKYLDPSIKEIREVTSPNIKKTSLFKREMYLIEFENGSKYELPLNQVSNILSTGTLKGIIIFEEIEQVLKTGGYYIVDELELHLNRTIILDIINLFEDGETNPYGATLIFSTHYTELLDSFSRNDHIIYIHRNNKYKIKTTNYSELSKRNELKRSDVYFADTFNLGTAISYNNFNDMRKYFIKLKDNVDD